MYAVATGVPSKNGAHINVGMLEGGLNRRAMWSAHADWRTVLCLHEGPESGMPGEPAALGASGRKQDPSPKQNKICCLIVESRGWSANETARCPH
jgi:hypothetical protein